MKNFLESSRYIVLIGIGGTFLAALALFIFGFAGVVAAIVMVSLSQVRLIMKT